VGGDDRWIHFNSLTYGQGSKMARPFFSEFIRQLELQKVSDFDPRARFVVPPDRSLLLPTVVNISGMIS
jgi:penicillin-binding protein 1A